MTLRLERVLSENGPTSFSANELAGYEDLFLERAALFYTPTEQIPARWIGSGPLHVLLPIVTPIQLEADELRMRSTTRFWTHLIQSQTGMIRWQPFAERVRVIHTRHDVRNWAIDELVAGTKPLTDALKVNSTGRSDGLLLHYLGVIQDDSPAHIEWEIRQELVDSVSAARIEIDVFPC